MILNTHQPLIELERYNNNNNNNDIPPEVPSYRPEGPESPDHIPSTSNIPQYSYAAIVSTIPHYNDLIVIKNKEERSLQVNRMSYSIIINYDYNYNINRVRLFNHNTV